MNLSRIIFTEFRTPDEQVKLVSDIYNCLKCNKEVKNKINSRHNPYGRFAKTYYEEFIPFTWFCEWKFGGRSDIECALVEGTPGGDGIIRKKGSKYEHNVEITTPVNQEIINERIKEAQQLEIKGITDFRVLDIDDIFRILDRLVTEIIKIAQQKELKDYSSFGGSTLIIVLNSRYFMEVFKEHIAIIDSLKTELSKYNFKVDNVFLLLNPHNKFIVIKDTNTTSLMP